MSIFTDPKDIQTLKEAGRRLALVLVKVIEKVRPGITPVELDRYAEALIRKEGDTPAFLGYQPKGASIPYPSTLCVSVNDNVVHGVPNDVPLNEGDTISIDIGLFHKGFAVDMARTVPVGEIDENAWKLLSVTEKSLNEGIKMARVGNRVGHISNTIGTFVENHGFSVVRELGGHGIGKEVHEEPFVPNSGPIDSGVQIEEGMALALEPIVNAGEPDIVLDKNDGYTYRTKDGKRSAHFEHTILVTKDGPVVITKAQ
jgi:methionyl aminopeptidase